MTHGSGFDPETAPVVEQDTNIPYANRTVSFFFWAGLFIIAVFIFIGWQMRGSADKEAQENAASTTIISAEIEQTGNPIEETVEDIVEGISLNNDLQAGLELQEAKASAVSTARPEIVIPVTNRENINMQKLENARIFDFEGNQAGSVETLVYVDENNANIYFELDPAIAPGEGPRIYSIPYDEVVITQSETGAYDIILNEEQTEAVASILLDE